MQYPFTYDFSDQTAVVTGAARGLGLEIAKALSELGASVVLTDIEQDVGEQVAQSIRAAGGAARFIHLDVTDPINASAVAEKAAAFGGSLDMWINNAGIARHGPSEKMSPEAWQMSIDIMLSGTFYGAQAAAGRMLDSGGGTILNIASVNGYIAQTGRASYASAKAGIIRLTEVLASEWGARGVRVNAVAPAVFMTDLVRASIKDGSTSLDAYLDRSPTGRLGEAGELLAAVIFLLSPFSSYITGQTLKIDGGWTADHYI